MSVHIILPCEHETGLLRVLVEVRDRQHRGSPPQVVEPYGWGTSVGNSGELHLSAINKAIAGCPTDEVEEIRTLAKTLKSWRTEILAHHHTGASNGPTEGLILWSGHEGVIHVVDEAGGVRRGRVPWSGSSMFT